ncbi:hypothetical protein KUT40_31450, partial [Pseudomonas aeruginosa]|nr:hypothetical protein [Pseudomonas aeruginosa]
MNQPLIDTVKKLLSPTEHFLLQHGGAGSKLDHNDTTVQQEMRKRLANTPPRFFQLAAWCPPVFGGHH